MGKEGIWGCSLMGSEFMTKEHWHSAIEPSYSLWSIHTSHRIFTPTAEYSHWPQSIHTSHGESTPATEHFTWAREFTPAMEQSHQPWSFHTSHRALTSHRASYWSWSIHTSHGAFKLARKYSHYHGACAKGLALTCLSGNSIL